MLKFLHRGALVILLIGFGASAAAAQRAGSIHRDSVGEAAAALLAQGRANEARIILLQGMRNSRISENRATYRIELGHTFLYEGQYQDASRAYNAVLSGRDSVSVDSLMRAAHHGLALIDAFSGRPARSATHYAEALRGPTTLADTIEMLVLTSQHDSALRALDRYVSARRETNATQFVQSFRGLTWMMAGHCTQALPEITKAPRQDGPVPTAVRARCASKHGQRIDALAMRDSVLRKQVNDPFAWYVLIARDLVRKIE